MHLEGIPIIAPAKRLFRLPGWLRLLLPVVALFVILPLTTTGCSPELLLDPELTKNVRLELLDWHVSGLWVINSPVCWFRVYNYNNVPITDITIDYQTFDFDGKPLDKGTYTLLDAGEPSVVHANSPKNCVEQYIGIVSLESDKLSCTLKGVRGK
ncbi:MAG: hypothetical protein JST01_15470 [Cyanobacteria bacterium SZAS TMP-1]|nr:hypothetical protein [Cyanobacteria bacterium SZAS TMP-1]